MKSTTTVKECIVCKKSYSLPLWLSKIKKTCSRVCGSKLMVNRRIVRDIRECLTCKKSFVKDNASKGKYCSVECYWDSKTRVKDYKCMDCGSKISPVKGIKRCQKCMGKNMSGSNHWGWLEDRTSLNRESKQGERRTSIYFDWRKQVWLRDKFACKIGNPDCSGRIEAHHILSWKDYPELRYEVNNGITLCHFHHPRKRNDEMRLSPYFTELVNRATF